MPRRFNVTGSCNPKLHYMVDITGRLKKIRELIDNGTILRSTEPDSMEKPLRWRLLLII